MIIHIRSVPICSVCRGVSYLCISHNGILSYHIDISSVGNSCLPMRYETLDGLARDVER